MSNQEFILNLGNQSYLRQSVGKLQALLHTPDRVKSREKQAAFLQISGFPRVTGVIDHIAHTLKSWP